MCCRQSVSRNVVIIVSFVLLPCVINSLIFCTVVSVDLCITCIAVDEGGRLQIDVSIEQALAVMEFSDGWSEELVGIYGVVSKVLLF